MDNRPIGILDLGAGGLAVAKELHRQLPEEQLLYCTNLQADGGGEAGEAVLVCARQQLAWLESRQVKAVVCASSLVSAVLEEQKLEPGVPYLDMIRPAARTACGSSAQGKIGVIARTEVIRNGAFAKAIHAIQPTAKVFGSGTPLLIPLVEDGMHSLEHPATRQALEKYLAPLARERIDTLLLGSAHLSPLYDCIGELVQYRITLVAPGGAVARDLQALLLEQGLLAERAEEPGIRCAVYGDSGRLERLADVFWGRAHSLTVEELGA